MSEQQPGLAPVFTAVPPQSYEAEQSVLGALLQDSRAVSIAVEMLREDDFTADDIAGYRMLVVPDCFTIRRIDLNDKANFLGSKRLTRHAIRMGWYDPQKDGEFDFQRAYSDPASLSDPSNLERNYRGRKIFFQDSLSLSEAPFLF